VTTLAVDLGGTHMRCAAVGEDGQVGTHLIRPTPRDGTGVSALVALINEVSGSAPCDSAVIGVPGRVDYRLGVLEHAPNLPPGWVSGLSASAFSTEVGMPVSLANDADLAAVGEAYFGAGKDRSDVVYLTLSTGVGAGVVLSGLLMHGRRSMIEIGHTVLALDTWRAGGDGTVEGLSSGTALTRAAGRPVLGAEASTDPALAAVWGDLVAAASATVINLAWLFSPDVIVIGGGLGLSGSVLLDPLRAGLEQHGPPAMPAPAIVSAGLGDDAGVAGAGAWERAFRPEAAGVA
jgi:glucokinase